MWEKRILCQSDEGQLSLLGLGKFNFDAHLLKKKDNMSGGSAGFDTSRVDAQV